MKEENKNFQMHPAIQFSTAMKELAKPLASIGIKDISYIRTYNDASFTCLISHSSWAVYFLSRHLYKSSAFTQPGYFYQSCIIPWETIQEDPIRAELRKNFSIGNAISILNKKEDYCEIFHFLIGTNTRHKTNYYISHIQNYKKFILYFMEASSSLIKKAEQNKIFLRTNYEQQRKAISSLIIDKNNFSEKDTVRFNSKSFYAIGRECNFSKLSPRECSIAVWLMKGKTTEETAIILGLSRRTVEEYINNLKKKVQAATHPQLIYKLVKLGFNPNNYV